MQTTWTASELAAALAARIIDEVFHGRSQPTAPAFGPALDEVIAGRYERRPTIITSNKSLAEWEAIVQDVSLAAALVDRLLHHGQVFSLKGPSWRTRGHPDHAVPESQEAAQVSHFYSGILSTCNPTFTPPIRSFVQ